MRIGFLLQKFPQLSETFILDQITSLIDLGHEVEIFSLSKPSETKVHSDVEDYDLIQKTHYIPKNDSNKLIMQLKALLILIANLCTAPKLMMGYLMLFIKRERGLSLATLYLLLKLKKHPVDILHCHYGPIGKIAVLLKKAGIHAAITTVFHGYDVSSKVKKHGHRYYDELFEQADLLLPISEFWKEELIRLGAPASKITVHHMGIRVDRFNPCEKSSTIDRPARVLSIGRLTEKKGFDCTIQAFAKSVRLHPMTTLYIAGSGPLQETLVELADSLGVSDRVIFTGAVTQDEILKLFEQSDIFMLSSQVAADGDMEGIPMVLMEAQACGLPTVSTMHSGIPEVVVDGVTGYLAAEKDVKDLSEKLSLLLSQSQLWDTMGKAGRDHIEKEFNRTLQAKELITLFNNILD